MRLTLLEICRFLNIACVGMPPKTALFRPAGAAVDSRAVKKGDLFFCLTGERADGHDFAAAAVEKGAAAVIGTRDPFAGGGTVPVLVVKDVAKALAQVAMAHRKGAHAVVIGVTGTSGKTSVKEALFSVLSERGKTAKNPVNLNNQIGLPLSMCNASEKAAYWVMEAGISQPGDMDELGEILRPDVALILNAGPGHLQELGDKGVAHYKARLLAHLTQDGFAVVSADYPDLTREAKSCGKEVLWFSAENSSQPYFATYLGPESATAGRFSLMLEGSAVTVTAPFQGGYGAENVAAVGAVAHALGLTEMEIAEGLQKAETPRQRFSARDAGRFLVIDDSYNANPLSMGRMLDAAAAVAEARKNKLVLVLGEMLELGPEGPEFHRELGRHAARLAPKAVYWKGGQGDNVSKGLYDGGFAGGFFPVRDAADFLETFTASGLKKGVVLFKGSRGNKLEELVAVFAEAAGGPGADKG